MKKTIYYCLNGLLILTLLFCAAPHTKADIIDPTASGTYMYNQDGTVDAIITVTYTNMDIIEWLQCVQFTFPDGWTYIQEVGGDATGFDQGSAGNVANFGNDSGCPTSSPVMYGPWGSSPNTFIFTMQQPADFDVGLPNEPLDGDEIPFTWTYLGDVMDCPPSDSIIVEFPCDELPTQSPLTDNPFSAPPTCYPGDIIPGFDTLTVCPTGSFTIDLANDTLLGGIDVFFSDVNPWNGSQTGTGGPSGEFTLTDETGLPFTSTGTLDGMLTEYNLPPLDGTWYVSIGCLDEFGQVQGLSEAIPIRFLNDPDDTPIIEVMCEGTPCNSTPDVVSAQLYNDTLTLDLGQNCNEYDLPSGAGLVQAFAIIYETDGTNIIDASLPIGTYNDGFILPNDFAFYGEVFNCQDFTITGDFSHLTNTPDGFNVYVIHVETSATGDVIFGSWDCPFQVINLAPSNYIPISDETDFEYWNHEFENIYCTDNHISTAEVIDSTVFGLTRKAYFNQFGDIDSSRYLLEYPYGVVAYFDENNMSTPQLLYDFSLNTGDTTSVVTSDFVGTNYHYTRIMVTETDNYISPLGTVHKRLYIEHIDSDVWYPHNVWIEGIGAMYGGLLYTMAPSDPHIELNKAWKTGELIYDQQKYCGVVNCNVNNPNETLTAETTLSLTWNGTLETAPMYFEVNTREAGSVWQIQYVETNTAYITDMQENTLYEWRVRKFCDGYYSEYSEERQFLNDPMSVQSIEQVDILLWNQNNTIRIERPNEQPADFFVYDITGRLLYTQKIGQYTNIDIDLPNGVYVGYFRENSGEQYSGKFVVAD